MSNKIKKYLLIIIICNLFLAQANLAYAQNQQQYNYQNAGVSDQIKELLCAPTTQPANQGSTPYIGASTAPQNNANSQDLFKCINNLYRFALIFASVIAVFFIVIAGYIYMSAEGNTEATDKAKNILTSSITALVILFAGYILLKALNPDLIQFQSIQPPSVAPLLTPSGTPLSIGGGASNSTVTDLEGSGCAFQTDTQKTEAPQMVPQLVQIVKNICYNVKNNYSNTQGHPATISSVIGQGQHATNSYHYKGCAVDFADGGGDGFFSLSTKNGRPTGVAIYQEALKAGISANRIDPGVDANRTDMIHIDLGNSCPSSGT